MDNFGDDLFAFVCYQAAKQFWNDRYVRLLSPSVPGFQANCTVPDWFGRTLYSRANIGGGLTRLLFALFESCRSDLFILGGGSVLSSQSSVVRNVIYKSSGVTRISFAAMGVSIGPFENQDDKERARDFLSDCLFVSVRDEASYQIAKEFDLPCPVFNAGDLAGLMPLLSGVKQKKANKNEPVIGVALCPYESIVGGDEQLENERNHALVNAVIESAVMIGASVEVFSLNNHLSFGDDMLAQDISSQLKAAGINFKLIRHVDYGVVETWRRIANCSFFVSVRLHGAIAAYLNEIPFVLVEYHKKCTDFLDDIGQNQSLRIAGTQTDSQTIFTAINELLLAPQQPEMSVEKYSNRALKHFSLLVR